MARFLLVLGGSQLLMGCFVVYHPLTGLQRPVAVNTSLPNFAGLSVHIYCEPGDMLSRSDAQRLCKNVAALFATQGATVRTGTSLAEQEAYGEGAQDGEDPWAPADMFIDLKSRLLHQQHNVILWMLSFGTLTLLPGMSEYSFAQDVIVRDSEGFLLAQDTYQARFIRYFGAGIALTTWLLDLTVREKHEQYTRGAVERHFTADFHGQLSQLVFNARTRLLVLRDFSAAASPNESLPRRSPRQGSGDQDLE